MATLVYDIETIGHDWDSLGPETQTALTNWITSTSKSTAESASYLDQVKNRLGLSPLTGSIVSLAMWDMERKQGVVYVVAAAESAVLETKQGFVIKYTTEKELLEDFWEGARSYDLFVSFNGRRFDVPFLLHRSVAQGVKPSVELAKTKYLKLQTYPYHIDLQDELTFYGSMYRRPSLHLFCTAYDIQRPKQVPTGAEVATLVKNQQYTDLATYNAADVVATAELYLKWKEFLAPASFINTIEM